MAAIAGSTHLKYSMDRKPDRKGWNRTHPQQHHPLPQGPLSLSTIDWPPEVLRKSTNNPQKSTAPTTAKWAQFHCHHSTSQHKQQLTSMPAWVEQLHLLTTTTTSRLHCLSFHPTDSTGVINCHCLTFDFVPRPLKHLDGVKGDTWSGTRPPQVRWHPRAPTTNRLGTAPECHPHTGAHSHTHTNCTQVLGHAHKLN